MRAIALWLTWAGLLTGSTALTVLVSIYDSPETEADAIRTVQSWPLLGGVFSDAVRAVTSTTFVLLFGAALVVFLWWSGGRREAVALAVAFAVLPLAQAGLKQLVDRPRPPEELIRAGFSSPSFPAGHVMGPVVMYGALLWLGLFWRGWGRWRRLAAVSWSAVILATTGVVNVYLGVHWPTDVLGGYLWGLVLLLPAVGVALQPHVR
jgi:membrane-associated phospholipid phosphatase